MRPRLQKADMAPWKFERRDVGPHDVQLEIKYCGVCHSDLHQIRNDWFPGIFPMVPGHEIVGKVIQTGAHVKKFKKGDLAGVGCLVDSCRTCKNCKAGSGTILSKRMQMPLIMEGEKMAVRLMAVIQIISLFMRILYCMFQRNYRWPAVAPLLCAGITTYSPLRYWKVGKGHKLAVLGLGGLGHMGVKFGVAFGAEVTVLSTSPSKEKDARKLGGA